MNIENYKKALESMSKEELINEISNLISDSGIQLQNKSIELRELKSALARANLQLQFQIGEVDIRDREIERLTAFETKAKCEIERMSKNEAENLKTVKNLQEQVDELTVRTSELFHELQEEKRAYARAVKDTAKNYKNFMILSIAEMLKYGEISTEQSDMLYNHNYQIYKGFIEEIQIDEQVEDPVKEIYRKGKELDKDFDMTGLGEYILANFLTVENGVEVK